MFRVSVLTVSLIYRLDFFLVVLNVWSFLFFQLSIHTYTIHYGSSWIFHINIRLCILCIQYGCCYFCLL